MRFYESFRPGALVLVISALLVIVVVFPTSGAESPAESGGTELEYESPRLLSGAIYDQASSNRTLLFKFQRRAKRSGQKLSVEREYTYPDGRIAATERVVYEGNQLSSFELIEKETGEQGRAIIRRSAGPEPRSDIEFEYSAGAGSNPKTGKEALGRDTVVNDMIGHFLIAHLDLLARGEKVKCRYIVIARRETVGFTFTKVGESSWQGREVINVRMAATSKLLAPLVKPVLFIIEKDAPHRVIQYSGRTTPKIKEGGTWKDLDAVTVFDWEHAER